MKMGGLGPVVVDVAGTALDASERERLRHPLVGMVILFARNFSSGDQLRALCGEIHALRTPPLLIAVDHEGGRVQRFREGFTALPPMAALGRLWDADVLLACRRALSLGYVLAAELRAHGVDLSFTPVLDLDWGRSAVIGDRALHRDARVVSVLAGRILHGLALAGMSHCGKHWPGHGWAQADSHVDLPVDERPLDELLAADAAPYGWLGIGLDAVMPAHVVYPQVDARPAGFSTVWLRDILRGRLGFGGAIFSDDLSMQGARAAGDVLAAGQAALRAGCDLVLVCNDPAGADRLLAGLEWTPDAAFGERLQRLQPRAAGCAGEAWRRSARYLAAHRDVLGLIEAHGAAPPPGAGHGRGAGSRAA